MLSLIHILTEYIAKASMEPRDYRVVFLIQKNTLISVSYTHLDVYKRQILPESDYKAPLPPLRQVPILKSP